MLTRVTKAFPCAVCGKPDWCGFNAKVVVCARIQSDIPTKNGGWIHKLDGTTKDMGPVYVPQRPDRFAIDCPSILQRYMLDTTTPRLESLSRFLGVSADSLRRLGACYAIEKNAWAFPMHDADRKVIGIRLRTDTGGKFAVPGSREGLFMPSGLSDAGALLLCEGPTDCAALLDLGFDAVGRPSCQGAVDMTVELVRRQPYRREVVIFADRDGPGLSGAGRLAEEIRRPVRIAAPPHFKDARAWINAGATRRAFDAVIASARYFKRPQMRTA